MNPYANLLSVALVMVLPGCGGPGSDDDGASGGAAASGGSDGSGGTLASGGTTGDGGSVASGGAVGSGGAGGTGAGGSQNTGGTSPNDIDPEDLGKPCVEQGDACPTGLTPTDYELCGTVSCDLFCACHLPCEGQPEVCPQDSTCTMAFNIEGDVCL